MRRNGSPVAVFLFLGFLVIPVHSQEALTNEAIVKLVKSNLSEELIVGMVSSQPGKYSLGADDVIALKNAGASDKVIAAMIAKAHSVSSARPAKPDPPPDSLAPVITELEVGVYRKQQDKLLEVTPEVVTWRTGGFLKTMATAGLTRGHVNGVVKNANSRMQLSMPVEFVIRCAEGVSAAEYQLLHMDPKSDRREFRAVTGGIIHASGGADRNAVPFKFEKSAARTFNVKLTDLKKGEYGFLPPGAITSASAASLGSAALGRKITILS